MRFVPADTEQTPAHFKPREPIPPRLQRFDPRIVELARLLARETARETIERSLREAETRNNPKTEKD